MSVGIYFSSSLLPMSSLRVFQCVNFFTFYNIVVKSVHQWQKVASIIVFITQLINIIISWMFFLSSCWCLMRCQDLTNYLYNLSLIFSPKLPELNSNMKLPPFFVGAQNVWNPEHLFLFVHMYIPYIKEM